MGRKGCGKNNGLETQHNTLDENLCTHTDVYDSHTYCIYHILNLKDQGWGFQPLPSVQMEDYLKLFNIKSPYDL